MFINNYSVIWGGLNLIIEEPFNSDVVIIILLNAGISLFICVFIKNQTKEFQVGYVNLHRLNNVKKPTTQGKSAGVTRNKFTLEASQRLNAGNLSYAYLVGLIEGDGWFSVSKKGIYLLYEFGIELHIRDVQLIFKIKNILGVGHVKFRITEGRSQMVMLRVRDKKHLKTVILPIFDKYPLLSNKQYDYIRFKNALLNDIIHYESLPLYTRPLKPLNSIESILKVPYFSAWLVGFIEAEGCFSVYKPTAQPSLVGSFEISQTNSQELILAISNYLFLTSNIHLDKTNSYKLKVTSVRFIENTIKFIQKAPVKFLGYKKLQYLLWLKQLRTIPRYTTKFSIPNKY